MLGHSVPVRTGGRVGVRRGLALEESGVPSPQAHGHRLPGGSGGGAAKAVVKRGSSWG